MSRSTVYEENNGAMVVATSPSVNHNSNKKNSKYHWLSQNVGKQFVLQKIESDNQKAGISPNFYNVGLFSIMIFL